MAPGGWGGGPREKAWCELSAGSAGWVPSGEGKNDILLLQMKVGTRYWLLQPETHDLVGQDRRIIPGQERLDRRG